MILILQWQLYDHTILFEDSVHLHLLFLPPGNSFSVVYHPTFYYIFKIQLCQLLVNLSLTHTVLFTLSSIPTFYLIESSIIFKVNLYLKSLITYSFLPLDHELLVDGEPTTTFKRHLIAHASLLAERKNGQMLYPLV